MIRRIASASWAVSLTLLVHCSGSSSGPSAAHGDGGAHDAASSSHDADAASQGRDAAKDGADDAGSHCTIGGVAYAPGEASASNPCETCQPALTTSAWSTATNGTACGGAGAGAVCVSGACMSGCEIGGVFSESGGANPENACQSCQPTASTSGWTDLSPGTSCGGSHVCCGAACVEEQTDVNNCGACGNACATGSTCCAGTCVDEQTDVNNCGACGAPCTGAAPGCCGAMCVADEHTDVSNCGACGHSCNGGACSAGLCQPVAIYSGGTSEEPEWLTVDANNVYWTDLLGGTVLQCPLAGCGGAPVTLSSGRGTGGITADAKNVYWASGSGSVYQVPIGGGALVTLATGQNQPVMAVVDSTYVYWTNDQTLEDGAVDGTGSVSRCAIGSSCGGAPTTLVSGRTYPYGIAIDTEYFYWTEYGVGSDTGAVLSCPLTASFCGTDGASIVTLASGLASPIDLVIDATNVYWTNGEANGSGSVMACAKGGCGGAPTSLASAASSHPQGIAVDSTKAYWAVPSGSIFAAPLESGPVSQPVSGQCFATAVAVDARNIYWTTGNLACSVGQRGVWRVAK